MCLGIPGRVVSIEDEARHIAKVDVSGVKRNVNVGLVLPDGLDVGDWVLIHVGFAISKIDEEEAEATLGFLREMGEMFDQELDDYRSSGIA
ncbi:MAG: HypC/HybG/HupF family hydrogenase formation chaperone [Gemmatimonadetes bacterium]|nr:HypC/HybG/HupF family hydrogenase formation chaperone [Gemmatimonadota bacterium]